MMKSLLGTVLAVVVPVSAVFEQESSNPTGAPGQLREVRVGSSVPDGIAFGAYLTVVDRASVKSRENAEHKVWHDFGGDHDHIDSEKITWAKVADLTDFFITAYNDLKWAKDEAAAPVICSNSAAAYNALDEMQEAIAESHYRQFLAGLSKEDKAILKAKVSSIKEGMTYAKVEHGVGNFPVRECE